VSRPRVALATCRDVPELDEDDRPLLAELAALGVAAEPAVWDDPGLDWAGYHLVVLRSTWDYTLRRTEFLAWVAALPRVSSPAPVIAWNTSKTYLARLAAAGLPVVPTGFVAPGEAARLPSGDYVLKPAVGAGSVDAGRYGPADAAAATAHLARLAASGRTTMIQPYLSGVDEHGETALVYLGGRFSHAVGKAAVLDGPDPGPAGLVDGLYRAEQITARDASAAELAAGDAVLGALPGLVEGGGELSYARVDLLPGPDGPLLLELELTEPSLFFRYAPGSLRRFAAVIAGRLGAGNAGGFDRPW
jgi:hypothetical protein